MERLDHSGQFNLTSALTVLVIVETGACALRCGARELTATCRLTDRVLRNSSRRDVRFVSAERLYLLDFCRVLHKLSSENVNLAKKIR
ncbi:hypothetical protein PHYPO_G00224300 [Pangasianodon hypophthalmus]|uniref:Secreted protein n=1 Tax=Pangasianodon hypophthalmus TaxID=310915 RepID=A0A5N5NVD2_PANHP|nr:hypothetical protein PHYPO_G00224300 [Pangasianodon hypophthalmus]